MTAYDLALKEIGTVEWAKGSNPKVVAYYRDAGHPEVKDDDVAWCAAFVGAMLTRAGLTGTGKLTARSYLDWGVPVDPKDIRPGDIVIFQRGGSAWQGHVGFAHGKPKNGAIEVLGGNQRDQVNIARQSMTAFLGARRAKAGPPVRPDVEPRVEPKLDTPKSGWLAQLLTLIAALFQKSRRN